ncbi:MAG TPA: hypothetical protein VFY43_08885 [Candidatus Limnocylindria bacterium]|nr:hypothetical protein [Candidatus Limnocylindria bacterium]
MRKRWLATPFMAASLVLAIALPVAAKDFGTIYVDGVAYRTFGNPAHVAPGTGTDPIISFTNFEQGGVSQFGPGTGAHGGRWAVWMATWVDPMDAHLVTDFDDALALAASGDITLVRAPNADFRCPILPNG